ncbi:MAG: ATP-binding protein [Bifidobacteriaceae bacterium]|jgi:predicted ATPase|nr:ATP-binding protein [Bifidobacteriaceae bacterium]
MLIRFQAENYRSISSPVELSMVAIDKDRPEARSEPMLGESLLPVAAIYGPNASGKSNLVAAFEWLRSAVFNSLRTWDDEIPVDPFAFGGQAGKPTSFELELTVNHVRFEYVLELSRDRVIYEGLFHYPERKRRRVFEREELELTLQRGLGVLSGTRGQLTPRTLALSVARRYDEPLVQGFASQLLRIRTFGRFPYSGRGLSSTMALHSTTMHWFEEPAQEALFEDADSQPPVDRANRDQALALLRLADLGIEDVTMEEQDVVLPGTSITRRRRRVVLFHRVEDRKEPLYFSEESEGTQTWFKLIGPTLEALRTGSIVVVDELDASLHPTLSAQLLGIFHSPDTNPLGAQLVFTSHDTSLFTHLNRDEVWLTEKRRDGSTRLGSLAEFAGERVRKSQNLESGYLHGRFGALPHIDQTDFLRALGLIG